MAYIMEYKGVPPINVLDKATWRHLFFDDEYFPLSFRNKKGKERRPNTKSLMDLLEGVDKSFIKFIDACFHWDPELWLQPEEALCHEWILKGLPKPLLEHEKFLGLGDPTMYLAWRKQLLNSNESDSEETETNQFKIDTTSENFKTPSILVEPKKKQIFCKGNMTQVFDLKQI